MPADLTREATPTFREKVRQMHSDLACGHFVSPSSDFLRELAEHALSEPTRLASARAEGVREGIEMAARWHDEAANRLSADLASLPSARRDDPRMGAVQIPIQTHRIYAATIRALSPPPAEPSDGWIEWRGGECPVQDGVETHAKTRDGVIGRSLEPRGWCGWQHDPRAPGLDIVAYRIVKPAEPSDEEWLRGLIAWCRPGVVRDALDRYLAEGTAVPDMTPIVQSAEPSAPVAPDWPTRCAALEADGIAARKRVAALEAENTKLRAALGSYPNPSKYCGMHGFEEQRFFADYDTFRSRARALLQGQGGADASTGGAPDGR